MSERIIDFKKSVCELSKEYPEVTEILAGLGFTEITKPGMLQTVGRFMTIPKGAVMRNVDISLIRQAFEERGYQIKAD